jgi:hypothetical protein
MSKKNQVGESNMNFHLLNLLQTTNSLNFFHTEKRFAFVDGLIKASNEGADLNDNGIREEIDLITFAVTSIYFVIRHIKLINKFFAHQGYDTTSAAMVWFLYLIAKHPEHQVSTLKL